MARVTTTWVTAGPIRFFMKRFIHADWTTKRGRIHLICTRSSSRKSCSPVAVWCTEMRTLSAMRARLNLVALFLGLFVVRPLVACQCAERAADAATALEAASAVFEGTVVDVRLTFGSEHGWLFPVPEYSFAITKAWKGVSSPQIRLLGGYSNCAYTFRAGSSYLVYAGDHWEKRGRLSSSICDRTMPLAMASRDISTLGAPTVSFAPTAFTLRGRRPNRLCAYLVGGLAAYRNLAWHPTKRLAWASVGTPSLTLMVMGVLAGLAAGALGKRRRGVAAGLWALGLAFVTAALFVSGQWLFSVGWLARYLE